MSAVKKMKDNLLKVFWGDSIIPRGLFELDQYFRLNEPITFTSEIKDGLIIARSVNFRHGLIITSGRNEGELDKNIKDAILTSFEVPSSYAKEAKIVKTGERRQEYALAGFAG